MEGEDVLLDQTGEYAIEGGPEQQSEREGDSEESSFFKSAFYYQ